MPARQSSKAVNNGFTLIEVLIAMSLTIVMSGLLFGALNTYINAGTVASTHLAMKDRTSSVRQFLRTQIHEIVPLSVREQASTSILFRGDEKQIVYVSYIPSHRSPGGLHHNALSIESDNDSQGLSFSFQRLNFDADASVDEFFEQTPPNPRVLIDEVEEVRFSYFGRQTRDEDPEWHDSWEEQSALPELIRIAMEFDHQDEPQEVVARVYNTETSNHAALRLDRVGRQRRGQQRGEVQEPPVERDETMSR